MPINKSSFQPKDARAFIVSYQDEEDEDDMSDFLHNGSEKSAHGKRIMTETQALVDFLKTTSPEEFQRPEKSVNTLFSRIRKPKRSNGSQAIPTPSLSSRSVPSSTASLPVTLASTITVPALYSGGEMDRKKHIELVPQTISGNLGNSRSPSMDASSMHSLMLRKNSVKGGEPILPNKKRDSSYSGSLRYSASVRSQLSVQASVALTSGQLRVNNSAKEFLNSRQGMDVIESALLQRLERIRLADELIPSDQVAAGLATEHVRALGITHILDNQYVYDSDKKVRHMQVQTETTTQSTPESAKICVKVDEEEDEEDEDVRARRAEAALENAFDHFEAISGLAYKKLRELWEEKTRWESACMELRDRILLMEARHNNGDYFLEENNQDELGLSEYPCSGH